MQKRLSHFIKLKTKISKEAWLFLGFCAVFVLLKLVNLVPRISDENLYFYTASLISKGFFPYRDFFFQHLPGQIVLYALVIKIFGFKLLILKLFPLFYSIGSAFLLFKMVGGNRGREFGVVAAGLFLFSYVTLPSTDYGNGPLGAIFFLLLSWYLFSRSAKLAGLMLFFALAVRFYILPAAAGIVLYKIWKRQFREVFWFLVYSAVPFIVVNLTFFLLYGEQFLTPVWRYHLLKSTLSVKQSIFSDLYKSDLVLFLFAIAGIYSLFTVVRRKTRVVLHKGHAKFLDIGISAALALIAQYLFFYSLSNVFFFYFVVLVPFLSVLGALSLVVFVPKRSRRAALLLVIALSLFNSFFYQKSIARMAVARNLDEMVADVQALTDEGDSIYGSYLIAPLVALKAERKIIDNEVDTNIQRYATGLISAQKATELATQSAVFFQNTHISKETGDILRFEPYFLIRSVVQEHCSIFRTYDMHHDFRFNAIILWDCTGE